MIDVKNLSFGYSTKAILRRINFSIKDSESVLILGVSGCGKTTLLKCLTGIIPNTIEGRFTGRVLINGRDTRKIEKIQNDIGIVLQDPETQILTTKVSHEIAFGLENLCYDKKTISKLVKKFAKKFRLSDKLNYDIKNLSYGEKKKVIIASICAMDKKILFFDEPLTNLDINMKKEMLKLLKRLKREGKTIVVAEQNPCILKNLFDKCLILDKGRLVYNGDVKGGMGVLKKLTKHQRVHRTKPEDDYVLNVQNLSFSYGRKRILKNIYFKIRKNEVVTITGENGCGKTTLALCLCNLLKNRKGKIELFNKKIDEYSSKEIAGKIGFVFQNPNFQIFKNSVIDEINYGPKNFGKEIPNRRMIELLNNYDLLHKKKSHPYSLSLGEKRRLTIASAVSSEPEILILDEPVFGQDPYHLSKILNSIIGKKTILIMTHEESLFRISNRVLEIKDGKMVEKKCGRAM
ncbi:MAG: ABC transporter ATP-binding protein [Candidatus Aenigmarchaeota archaeon]|nr:ABC transporter ATP-binding protein [Candidatus Aenigmarchaeota archaeon]